jgi:hypothetical protein
MALNNISKIFGRGMSYVFGTGEGRLRDILVELQGLKVNIATGAAVNTNIGVTGIAVEDSLVFVGRINGNSSDDLSDEASITSAGNIQTTTTATSSGRLLVIWFDKDGA